MVGGYSLASSSVSGTSSSGSMAEEKMLSLMTVPL